MGGGLAGAFVSGGCLFLDSTDFENFSFWFETPVLIVMLVWRLDSFEVSKLSYTPSLDILKEWSFYNIKMKK